MDLRKYWKEFVMVFYLFHQKIIQE